MDKLNVAVAGATGAVGQRFIQLLEHHPWFRVAELIASSRSAGQLYGDVVNWVLDGQPPTRIADLRVKGMDEPLESLLVFSALPKEAADPYEMELAAAGHVVCTNASTNRMVDDVPLLLPEVNADHIRLINVQRQRRGWGQGAVIANSNCTSMPVVMALAPLLQFGVTRYLTVSAQAASGAGYPGVASLDILDNVIPYVSGDEQKMETEPLKMLGRFSGGDIEFLNAAASATCTRVSVTDGHLVSMSVSLEQKPPLEAIIDAWTRFTGPDPVSGLPSAPEKPVLYLPQIDRPQVRRDRDAGRGMTTTIGRLRPCPLLGYKFAALSHNTIRGAAGCSILNAELLAVEGYLADYQPLLIEQRV